MSRAEHERFADILQAIERCQAYSPYLRSDELTSMAYDAVLRNQLAPLADRLHDL